MRTPPTNGQPGSGGRREQTERRIMESTLELLTAGATWHQLGIRQIADRADISRTAFYDFFASKNEILEHMIRGLHDQLGALVVASSTWRADDPRSPVLDLLGLRQLLATVDGVIQVHHPIYRAFLDAARLDPAIDGLWGDLIGAYVAIVERAIDHVRAQDPRVPNGPASDALARVLVLMTERTMVLLGGDPDRDGHAAHLEALAVVWERSVFGAHHAG